MVLSIQLLPLCAVLAGSIVLYFVVLPVITYFWDPMDLRKYPNQNAFSGLTNLAMVYEAFGNFRTAKLYEAHKKHPIIRTGPTTLSFRDVQAIKDIYGHHSPFRKGDNYTALHSPYSNMLTVVDKGDHARKRKMLSNAFATRNLMNWEYKVFDKVQRVLDQFDKVANDAQKKGEDWGIVNYQLWANLFTVAAICDIGLSFNTSMLENANDLVTINKDKGDVDQRHFIKGMHSKNRPGSIFIWATVWTKTLRKIAHCVSPRFRAMDQEGDRFKEILRYMIRTRIERHKKEEKLDDFFHSLMEDRSGSLHNLDFGEVMAEVSVILEAGSETTAIALTNLMWNLARNPDKLALLRKEIDENIGDDKIPSYDKVRVLPCLKACIDENLRMWPSITHGLTRVTPPEGGSVMGQRIAGDVTVSIPMWVAHRDEAIWPNPEEFLPERFLDSEKAKEIQSFYNPFSTCARGCVGRNISLLEQYVLTAALVKRYDFELVDPNWQLTREEALVCWTGTLPPKLRRRIET